MGKAQSLDGKDLMLWVNSKVVALSTGCTINISATTVSSDTKDDGIWGADEVGKMNWNCSNDSVSAKDKRTFDQSYDELFDMMVAHQPIDVEFGVPQNANNTGVPENGWTLPAGHYKGKAIITSLNKNGNTGAKSTMSVGLNGHGALERIDPES